MQWCVLSTLGTIEVFLQHIFGFLGPTTYVSKICHFLTPPTNLLTGKDVILEWSLISAESECLLTYLLTYLVDKKSDNTQLEKEILMSILMRTLFLFHAQFQI